MEAKEEPVEEAKEEEPVEEPQEAPAEEPVAEEPHEHEYNLENIRWVWNGFDDARAILYCDKCGEELELIANIEKEVVEPTMVKEGKYIYTAKVTFEEKEYVDIKEEEIAKLPLPDRYDDICPRPEARMKQPEGLDFVFFAERVQEYGPDGNKQPIYPGDDGIPFVNENIILDADGLGGNSAMKHRKFNRALFEEDLVFDTLFGDMYGSKEDNKLLNDYIVDSFGSFISIRNLYSEETFGNSLRYKKSGHFGSRIASAVLLHQLLNKDLQNEVFEVFDNIKMAKETENEENAKSIEEGSVKEISKKIEETFKKEFIHAAHNGGFEYESEMQKMDVLGTTMCATIVRENEEDVEALYLLAGDSLPFLLNKDGLFEIMHAHEGADGGMTNRIHSNDENFYFEPKYLRVKKPCILFNASDGVFDCKYFISPMVLERLILDTIVESNNKEEVANKLCEYFVNNGTHDDSSTMAAKFFGFKDYEELKRFASNRIEEMNAKYFDESKGGMADLFHLFELEKNNAMSMRKQNEGNLIYELGRNPNVVEHYKSAQGKKDADLARFQEEVARLNEMITYMEEEIAFHSKSSFSNASPNGAILNDLERSTREALLKECDALKRLKEKADSVLASKADQKIYKSFKEEMADVGLKAALESLVRKGVITLEEVNTLLEKCHLSLNGEYEKMIAELEKKNERQKAIFEPYDKQYNSLAEGK